MSVGRLTWVNFNAMTVGEQKVFYTLGRVWSKEIIVSLIEELF
jgi:hypothetical protein